MKFKWPTTRIRMICLVISGYCIVMFFQLLIEFGFSEPKALLGSVIGAIVFAMHGFSLSLNSK